MLKLIRRHHISFKNAINGIIWAFITQPNFRVHILLSVLVVSAGVYFDISRLEMTIIILTIIFGLGVEMVNTSIEAMTDLLTLEYRESAKIAKDVAAGMMLLTAAGALIISGIIFIPKISGYFPSF